MRRYIVLLLITGIVWAQTDFDTLILKSGTAYFGEYSKLEEEIVYFKPQNAFAFQPISIKQIQTLKLKDGHFIIGDILTYEEYQKELIIIEDGKNSLTLEEYQKLSTKEKAIYDANLYNVQKWALYGPTSIIVFMGSTFLMGGEFWESPIFSGGSSAASFYITYLVFNNNEKFNFPKSILTDSEKEIYEQAYFKKLQKRRFNVVVGSCVFIGVIVIFAAASFSLDFGSWGGLNCGPPCGGNIDVDYP